MKEKLLTKPAAVVLGTALALGLTACDRPFSDPNSLADCPTDWTSSSYDAYVTDMSQSMASLEIGRTKLLAALQAEVPASNNLIDITEVPGKYRAATELLVGHLNDYYYDATDNILSTPRAEFCTSTAGLVMKSPDYVRAEAALQASGIEVPSN